MPSSHIFEHLRHSYNTKMTKIVILLGKSNCPWLIHLVRILIMSHRLPICWEESLFHSKGQWNIKNQSLSITLRYLYWLAHSVSASLHMRKDSYLTEPGKTKEWPFGFSVRKGKVSLWDGSGPLCSKGNFQKLGTHVYTLSPVKRLGALLWFNDPSWKFNLIFFFLPFCVIKEEEKSLTIRWQNEPVHNRICSWNVKFCFFLL